MTKQELNEFFLQKIEEREKLKKGALRVAGNPSLEDKKNVVTAFVDNTVQIVDLLSNYLLEHIQPFSDGSAVWWSWVLNYVAAELKKTFDESQLSLHEHIGVMMSTVETVAIKVDADQFPGGLKDE